MRKLILTTILLFTSIGLCFARVEKDYFPDGRLHYVQVYDKDGNIVGPYKVYWQNGRLREKIIYKNEQPYIIHRWAIDGRKLQ